MVEIRPSIAEGQGCGPGGVYRVGPNDNHCYPAPSFKWWVWPILWVVGKKNRHPARSQSGPSFQNALAMHQAGRFVEAEAMYRQLSQTDPNVLQLLGVLCYQTGRRSEGRSHLEKALQVDPHHLEALTNLGVALHEDGQFTEALAAIEKALARQPNRPDLLDKRGFILQDLDRHEEAETSFRHAIQIEPTFADAWFHLGNSLQSLGRSAEAQQAFHTVLRFRPRDDEAMTNLGVAMYHQVKLAEAVKFLRQAIQIRPSADAYRNLATVLAGLGEQEAALTAAKTATSLEPKNPATHFQLGQLLQSYQMSLDALPSLTRAVDLAPDRQEYGTQLAMALNQGGEFEKALSVLAEIQNPSGGTQFAQAILVPTIPQSTEQIEAGRARVLANLQSLAASAPQIENPNQTIGLTNFYWSYHSESELYLQQAAVEAYRKCSPDLFWESPYLEDRRSGKFKVGVICSRLNQHTIGKLFLNLVGGLRDEDIEVIVFDCGTKNDEWTLKLNQQVDAAYKLIPDIQASRQFVAEQRLDAVFYPEIGMDPTTYYLAFSRLAPVQFMTWGHPSSPALPHMDYFLSSQDLERDDAQSDYAEKLILFDNLMTVYDRPSPPPCSRSELGLPEDRTIYACPQSLFKVHPDMDGTFAEILRRDEKGLLVFLTGNERRWDELLMQRLRTTMPDVAGRVLIHRRLNWREYIGLCDTADAVLDTFYFGGGNSSLEAFSAGAPVVTLPGKMLRGRITLAQYRAMQIEDSIATDAEDYAELAIRLANDKPWHREMKQLILERSDVLYGNQKPIEELRAFVRGFRSQSGL